MLELGGREACHALEELGKERLIGKIHVIGDLGDGFVAVLEVYLDAGDQSIVNPLLGALAAHPGDDGAQVSWRETQLRGVEVDGVVLGRKAADQLDKVGEQLLLAGQGLAVALLVPAPQVVGIPQQGTGQMQCHLAAVGRPHDVVVEQQVQVVVVLGVLLIEVQVKVPQVPVKGLGDAVADGQLEQVIAQGESDGLYIARSLVILDDAVGAQIDQVASDDVVLDQVKRGMCPALLEEQ